MTSPDTAVPKKMPSVSKYLSIFDKGLDGYFQWVCDQMGEHKCCRSAARAYTDEAVNIGQRVHLLREYLLQGKDIGELCPTDYEAALFKPIAEFYQTSGHKAVSTEQELRSEVLGLVGRSDGICTFEKPFWETSKRFWDEKPPVEPQPGDLWIEDLKVRSKLDRFHPLQGVGYRKLEKEINGRDIKWMLIVRRPRDLDKTPALQIKGYYLPYYEAYWNATELMWRYLHG